MADIKGLKTFIIFEKMSSDVEYLKVIEEDIDFKLNQIKDLNVDHINEYELLKEYEREIPSENLTEDGDIEYEFKLVKRVAKVVVWDFKDSKFIIAFFRGINTLKIRRLIEVSLGYKVRRLDFDKVFFGKLIELPETEVLQTTFKAINTDQEFSIEGLILESSNNTSQNLITELEIKMIPLEIKFRISRIGRVSFYGEPKIENIITFVEIIMSLINENLKGEQL